MKIRESGDVRSVEVVSPTRIVTLEDAVAFAEVDATMWRVKSWECTSWEVAMKLKASTDDKGVRGPDRVERVPLWRVSLKLERIAPKFILDGLDSIFKRMEAKSIRFDHPHIGRRPDHGSMLEINIPDLHLGKLCWGPETGNNYDLKIAEEVYDSAVVDLLRYAKGFDVERVVFLLGSDYFHFDTPKGTTTGGTPLDVDGRMAKMFEAGFMGAVRAIHRAAETCVRVDAVYVPGNHDGTLSYCMARAVAAQFHQSDRIHVDYAPCVRKYVRHGVNLIGYTHGQSIKRDKLPLIMATERKKDWAETTCREWHLGHLHTSKCDEFAGVKVRVVSSLSGTDAWHFEQGYVGNARAAEAFVYDRDRGFVANFATAARE
jgi:UDP-2,3-diacylglucosamine pyrophosphatase LpxH